MIKQIKKLRSKLLEVLTHKLALPLITKFRRTPPFPYTMEDLLQFPDNTLGKDLAIYLQERKYSLLRNYERHDCKHIILQFAMDEVGEARMQFYFFGNSRYSLPVITTVMLVFILMPEHWSKFFQEFKRGRIAPSFKDADFSKLVLMNTNELRKQYTLCETPRTTPRNSARN